MGETSNDDVGTRFSEPAVIGLALRLRAKRTLSRKWLLDCPPDGVIRKAGRRHCFRLVQISAVEDHRRSQQPAHDLEIRVAELLPLGDDRQPVGSFERA